MFRKKQVEEIIVYASELRIGDRIINDGNFVEVLNIVEGDFDELHILMRSVVPPRPDSGKLVHLTINRNLKVLTWR